MKALFFKSHSLAIGLAMFSMFFGAGNVIFPLVVGQIAGNQTPYAISGLLLTAVGVPFMGLIGIILFQGHYPSFFARMGKIPGFILAALIMLVIGPFGGIPRCIALSYSTMKVSWPSLSLGIFSSFSCLIIFLCTFKKNRILDLLSYIFTPLLLLSLFVIIIAGLLMPANLQPSSLTPFQSFTHGLIEGYNTMDLLASFFFSSIIFNGLKHKIQLEGENQDKEIFFLTLKASCIGAFLLSLIYVGFSVVAAYHAPSLAIQSQDELLGNLTLKILGPQAGLIATLTIALACLTTAIALAAVFADFLQKVLLRHRINYLTALLLTLTVACLVSSLEFQSIVALLAPLLQVAYPALIVLTLANIIHRLFQFKPIKIPVYVVLVSTLILYFM